MRNAIEGSNDVQADRPNSAFFGEFSAGRSAISQVDNVCLLTVYCGVTVRQAAHFYFLIVNPARLCYTGNEKAPVQAGL